MRNRPRGRALTDRLALNDEAEQASSPSYFEWREQTISTKAFQPAVKPPPKVNPIVRLFRRFG